MSFLHFRVSGPIAAASLLISSAALKADARRSTAQVSSFAELQRNSWSLPTADGAARLYITEIGHGPPVIFLHGGPGNDFQYIVEALEPHTAHNRFILFDDRGSLLSPIKPGRQDTLTLRNLVEDLEHLRISLGLERLTLFGHSFGSLLALSYYQAYPNRVQRLVLTGAFPPNITMKALIAAMRPRQKALRDRPEVAQILQREGLAGSVERLNPRQVSERNRIAGLAAINLIDLNRWRDVYGGGVYYNQDVDSAIGDTFPESFDFRPVLRSGLAPVTIIQGDRDYIDPAASGWQSLMKSEPKLPVRVITLQAASHYAWIDDPAGFARSLRTGLGSPAE